MVIKAVYENVGKKLLIAVPIAGYARLYECGTATVDRGLEVDFKRILA